MLIRVYLKHFGRLCFRRVCPGIFLLICFYLIFIHQENSFEQLDDSSSSAKIINSCDVKPAIDEFILNYKSNELMGTKPNIKRAEPTIERIRTLLEIIRSKEAKYQSLLETFDVFDMLKPMLSLKPYTDESNTDEIKTLYNRYIKLMPDKKTIEIDSKFLDYLRTTSSYLSDGLRNKRTKKVMKTKNPIKIIHFF